MKPTFSLVTFLVAASATSLAAADAIIIEAESGTFSGWVDRHSCWHNVMLTDDPHSTH